MKLTNDTPKTTNDDPWHILSPRPHPGGRSSLCGLHNDASVFDSPNEAYVAHVEGWVGIGKPCRRCLGVALIAMGASNDVTE